MSLCTSQVEEPSFSSALASSAPALFGAADALSAPTRSIEIPRTRGTINDGGTRLANWFVGHAGHLDLRDAWRVHRFHQGALCFTSIRTAEVRVGIAP